MRPPPPPSGWSVPSLPPTMEVPPPVRKGWGSTGSASHGGNETNTGHPFGDPTRNMEGLRSATEFAHEACFGLPDPLDLLYYGNFEGFGEGIERSKKALRRAMSEACGHEGFDAMEVKEAHAFVVRHLDRALEQVDGWIRSVEETKRGVSKGNKRARDVPAPEAGPSQGTCEGFDRRTRWKPQDGFAERVDNSNLPFRHKKREALIEEGQGSPDATSRNPSERDSQSHPFANEIMEWKLPLWEERKVEPAKRSSMESFPFHYVDTLEELKGLGQTLELEREIAVDLEHHSYRSFQGFVCLIQISTRTEDYIIDALALRESIGRVLGKVFANGAILKVLHGANHDVRWLQRDFGIYTVGLFDTACAARCLNLSGSSLAFLLEKYCGVIADKSYQLSDWRVRPITDEMMQYARQDTHFLLHIYDCICQDLLLRGLVKASSAISAGGSEVMGVVDARDEILKHSKQLCLSMYEKEIFTGESYLVDYKKVDVQLNPQQLSVFAALCAWRDRTARKLDESKGYVMSRRLLTCLSQWMPNKPKHVKQKVRGRSILVEKHASEIAEIIMRATKLSAAGTGICLNNHMESGSTRGTEDNLSKCPTEQDPNKGAKALDSEARRNDEECKDLPTYGLCGLIPDTVEHVRAQLMPAADASDKYMPDSSQEGKKGSNPVFSKGKNRSISQRYAQIMASMELSVLPNVSTNSSFDVDSTMALQTVSHCIGDVKEVGRESSEGDTCENPKSHPAAHEDGVEGDCYKDQSHAVLGGYSPDFLPLPLVDRYKQKRKHDGGVKKQIQRSKASSPRREISCKPSLKFDHRRNKDFTPLPVLPAKPWTSAKRQSRVFDGFTMETPKGLHPGSRSTTQPARGNRTATFGATDAQG